MQGSRRRGVLPATGGGSSSVRWRTDWLDCHRLEWTTLGIKLLEKFFSKEREALQDVTVGHQGLPTLRPGDLHRDP